MKRYINALAILILQFSLFALPSFSQIRGTSITVTVTPDHKDWTYKTGETCTFAVNVLKSGTLLDNAEISYEMGPEMYPDVKKTMTLKDGSAKISGKMNKPGFYRLTVTAKVGGKEYKAWSTAAYSPEQLQPTAQCPKDFDEFWAKAIEEARWTSLEPTIEYLPERSSDKVSTYHVSFQNDRWGRRVYGILNVPTKPGKYPAILKVPGAGVRPYGGDSGLAQKGVVVLEIGIHGIPVIKEQAYYDNLFTAALADYWTNGSNNRDRSYYKHVITGCIRSIDFLESLSTLNSPALPSSWDGKNLGVCGSSQGGFLTIATTALDKRVSCYAPVHAAMCDHEASLKKIACGWPHMFYNVAKPDMAEVECMRYYDGVNFARRITVPGWFSFGYNDDVVAPTSMYATYNVAGGEKTLSPYQQTAHFWYEEQYTEWFDFLLGKMGVK
ncbi:MAG: acetylxylan esterase [Bacteroidaceae bacterium]|nr:acetylxylan esterase [Bacteroidaceae bacterium]